MAGLRVDTALLPDLYTGRTPLAASRLHALNPAIALPARLVGVTAAGDGEQTRRLTGYLAGAAPPRWTAGAADALSVALPGGNMQVLAGASAVAAELSAAPSAGVGYLGYLDVATATPSGLPAAAVVAAGRDGGQPLGQRGARRAGLRTEPAAAVSCACPTADPNSGMGRPWRCGRCRRSAPVRGRRAWPGAVHKSQSDHESRTRR